MLTKVIVPVFTQSDLESLPNCLRYLAQQGTETLLVLHGPNVGVVNAEATKEFDEKISAQETRKKELTLVENYADAQKAKEQIETLRVDRDMAIREAWKKVPEDQRQAMYKKAFANIGDAVLCLREAYQHDQVFTMLQAFLPQMPADLPHGEFAIVWPRSIGKFKASFEQFAQSVAAKHEQHAPTPLFTGTRRDSREAELKSMHHIKAITVAKQAGVDVKGKKVAQVIQELLDKEFPREAVAA